MHCKPQLSFFSYHAHFKLINYVYNMTASYASHLYIYFNAVNVVPLTHSLISHI